MNAHFRKFAPMGRAYSRVDAYIAGPTSPLMLKQLTVLLYTQIVQHAMDANSDRKLVNRQ